MVLGYSYDANGNQLTTPQGAMLEYDADNRMTRSGSESYQYHPSGWRVWKATAAWGSFQLYGPGGQMLADPWTDYVYFGGRLLFAMSGSFQTAIYRDRLGSVRFTYYSGGFGASTTRNYYPFGEEITATTSDLPKFAGTYRDATSGLDYALNRYYSSNTGRFLSVDAGGRAPGNPQRWNRYSYSLNDPVNLTDPTGLDPEDSRAACQPWPYCLLPGFYTGGGGSGGGRGGALQPSLEERFAERYGVSVDCARGLFERSGPNGRPTDESQFEALRHMLERAREFESVLRSAGEAFSVDWSILAAIGIRETGFQNIAEIGGGGGRGVFQIDITRNRGVTEEQAFNIDRAARWTAQNLYNNLVDLLNGDVNFNEATQMAVAAHNRGIGGILDQIRSLTRRGLPASSLTAAEVDARTTGRNYGANVLDISRCFQ